MKGYITFLLNKKKIWKMMVKGIWILSRMEGKWMGDTKKEEGKWMWDKKKGKINNK